MIEDKIIHNKKFLSEVILLTQSSASLMMYYIKSRNLVNKKIRPNLSLLTKHDLLMQYDAFDVDMFIDAKEVIMIAKFKYNDKFYLEFSFNTNRMYDNSDIPRIIKIYKKYERKLKLEKILK